jgi:hypothetical protein
MADFNPDKALVIIVGASKWPECPNEMSHDGPESENPFLNSATGMEDYFLNYLRIKEDNLLNLFNSEETPSEIVNKMTEFLKGRNSEFPDKKDLFFYYVGHGSSPDENNYFMFLRSTRQDHVYSTSFHISHLQDVIKEARHLRCYVIVDACFSGKIFYSLPPIITTAKGIVLFCSSMAEKTSSSKGSEHRTMFTSAVLKVLEKGKDRTFSFDELYSSVSGFITETYKDIDNKAVIPQIQSKQVQENLAKIPIFNFHKPKKPDENNRMITWHITTSSKGGVGKTLLSLFLVTYYTTNGKTPLVIDLNAQNPDLKRVLFEKEVVSNNQGDFVCKIPFESNELEIVKLKQDGIGNPYLLGWLKNPFKGFEAISFFEFLSKVRQSLSSEIEDEIDTLIIDTGYNFGNIFSQMDDDYQSVDFWKTDRLFIWFIWVYRQIKNCYDAQANTTTFSNKTSYNYDVTLMKRIAKVVESHTNTKSDDFPSPFIHMINPISLAEEPTVIDRWMSRLSRRDSDPNAQDVDKLSKMANLDATRFVFKFQRMVETMVGAMTAMKKALVQKKEEECHEEFEEMLKQLETFFLEKLGQRRPKNLFPIYTYQKNLGSYHNSPLKLAEIRELKVYKTFERLFGIYPNV